MTLKVAVGLGPEGLASVSLWEAVLPQFSELVFANAVAGTRERLEARFSTTTPCDRICGHIALMDACKHYFKYQMSCICGIPYIELLGTAEDWERLEAQAKSLSRYKLTPDVDKWGEWLDGVIEIAGQFVAAARGHPDLAFWGAVCNVPSSVGEVYSSIPVADRPIMRWISGLFPYTKEDKPLGAQWRESYEWTKSMSDPTAAVARAGELEKVTKEKAKELLREAKKGGRQPDEEQMPKWANGLKLEEFPGGLSSAPVDVSGVSDEKVPVRVAGGLVAVYQHPDGALEPRSGWAVVRDRGEADILPGESRDDAFERRVLAAILRGKR